ncbi:aarF domain-containing kinase 1 [Condylostylus longicornis]|uniref:aarF domain-containing kinase 1 n=1 Tax=Condylostylus longicornis TaxID=2530218 RepID=UPI00244E202D|nr:aarF domain-containing kinase 1 [Condylostylus longicornis]XP_055384604.1 aarF domain-containing kinase 1 [Condylostylus longicornis]XP_055384605.1 aarF domain-containing kinase 1 [Condylostylus longicornis]XP_055384606.1 aarF domain-containing kinase 1 [Condylostylus longicornis]XP_055384607.1 aarF domain-containing kinase 1 [Condylostylus longicornis]XP_055384608.1 aarF domain-containing kinase 1 [Condylostylus longicornis]XP_055384610.1 aarF domain-containing kinase 1 [Condylostylus lon
MRFRQILKYSLLGSACLSTAFSLRSNDYEIYSLGIVRLARSTIAVIDIAQIYKKEVYYKKWDEKSEEYDEAKSRAHKYAADRLLDLICKNKGVYIKVGQHIGGLQYLLPPEYVDTMKILHNDAPSNPIEDLFKVVKQDLKKDVKDIFESFDPEPLGTASLAQVHKAKLKTGETVAVKIQHPYVKGNSLVDMKTMEILVKLMTFIFPDFNIQWLVDETKKNLPQELNFLKEGQNAEKVSLQFSKYDWIKIPKIYWKFSTPRILVMEFVEGGHVTDVEYIRKNKIDPFDISTKIGKLYSDMIFINGFVHSDPHPGNILVNKNSKGKSQIILLDHGLYAQLTDKFRYDYSNLWLSILRVDREGMKKHAVNLGIKDELYGLFVCMITGRPWESIMKGLDRTKKTAEERKQIQRDTQKVLPQIAVVLAQVDRQMLLIMKTNDLIRGIETTLKTHNRMTALWVMSKCCTKSSFAEERKKSNYHGIKKFQLFMEENWAILKLNLYYIYLGIKNFSLISSLKQIYFQ